MAFGVVQIAEYKIQKSTNKIVVKEKINTKFDSKFSTSELLAIAYLLVFIREIRTFREDTSGYLYDIQKQFHQELQDISFTINPFLFSIAEKLPSQSDKFNIRMYYHKKYLHTEREVIPLTLHFKSEFYKPKGHIESYISMHKENFEDYISAVGFFGEIEAIRTLKLFKEYIFKNVSAEIQTKTEKIECLCLDLFRHYVLLKMPLHIKRKEINNPYVRKSMRQFETIISPLWESISTDFILKDLLNTSGELLAKFMIGS